MCCLACDPPRPGRREDTVTSTVAAAATYDRDNFAVPDDKPTLAELMADDWTEYDQ